jgi:hypothetical protein
MQSTRHPESSSDPNSILRLTFALSGGGVTAVIAQSDSSAVVEVGILPTLLKRKRLVLDRIKELKPQDRLASLRSKIEESVDDESLRAKLFAILNDQETEERSFHQRIEDEARATGAALRDERVVLQEAVIAANVEVKLHALEESLRVRSEALENTVGSLENRLLSRFDVMVTAFFTCAALAGMAAAVIALVT